MVAAMVFAGHDIAVMLRVTIVFRGLVHEVVVVLVERALEHRLDKLVDLAVLVQPLEAIDAPFKNMARRLGFDSTLGFKCLAIEIVSVAPIALARGSLRGRLQLLRRDLFLGFAEHVA